MPPVHIWAQERERSKSATSAIKRSSAGGRRVNTKIRDRSRSASTSSRKSTSSAGAIPRNSTRSTGDGSVLSTASRGSASSVKSLYSANSILSCPAELLSKDDVKNLRRSRSKSKDDKSDRVNMRRSFHGVATQYSPVSSPRRKSSRTLSVDSKKEKLLASKSTATSSNDDKKNKVLKKPRSLVSRSSSTPSKVDNISGDDSGIEKKSKKKGRSRSMDDKKDKHRQQQKAANGDSTTAKERKGKKTTAPTRSLSMDDKKQKIREKRRTKSLRVDNA